MTSSPEALNAALGFVRELESRHIHYNLAVAREDALMVTLVIPGERWEVEFLTNGTVEVERFRSDGNNHDESAFAELWAIEGS